jgi:hypothetical protein
MRKYLIGVIAGLVSALAFSSVASADITGLIATVNVTPSKQDKKVRGPVNVFFESDGIHTGVLQGDPQCVTANLACRFFPPSTRTLLTFPTDFKFDPGNLPDCPLASLQGKTTASARAACPKSVVGTGTNIQGFLDGRLVTGTITAFNGVPSGGFPSLYLHVDLPGVASKPILQASIQGNKLDVVIPPVPGSAIDDFTTTLNGKLVTGKKKLGNGKVKKKYYFSAKCSTGTWTTTETVTYSISPTSSKTLTDQFIGKCTKKKKKKKK